MDSALSDLEQLLRSSRAEPRPEFLRELEDSLLRRDLGTRQAARPRRARASWTRLAVGYAIAIAALVTVLGVAGLRPLGGGTTGAKADRTCVTVRDWQVVREPTLVVGADGRMSIRYRSELVSRPRIRCR